MRRFLAGLLAAAVIAGTPMTLSARAAGSPFPDISDARQAEAAEFLRLMGVVNGAPDGTFSPNGTLTRAEFCKMAVEAMGNGEKAAAQKNRTIFKDVASTHWANGYINLATQSVGEGSAIIRGDATGSFRPDDPITASEAVTILMRVLGHSDATVGFGSKWYDGYLSTAAAVGLTEDLALAPESPISRGNAAILFYNLYFTPQKGSEQTYFAARGGREVEAGVVLSVNATAADGSAGAFKTTVDTYKTDRAFDSSLEGQEGTALLNAEGKLVAFRASQGGSRRSVNILSTDAFHATVSGGERVDIASDTPVYRSGSPATWTQVYLDIAPSTSATLYYGSNGKLSYIFLPSVSGADGVMVARSDPAGKNPFASMAGGKSFTMYKNGSLASAADLRQYDVAVYDAAAGVMQVSDLKLTGVYENVSPSPSSPASVTVMGETFSVLPSARDDLASFKLGEQVTLLLTLDGKSVAGAVSPSVVQSNAVGVAAITGGKATVELLQGGLTVSGEVTASDAERFNNQLVTVTSTATGKVSLALVSGGSVPGSLNTAKRTLGDKEVSDSVVVYDRVPNGRMEKVDFNDLPATVAAGKISFVSYDYAGRVRYLVLSNVTGDAYTYGIMRSRTETRVLDALDDTSGETTYQVRTAWMIYGDEQGKSVETEHVETIQYVKDNVAGGMALTADGKIADTVLLEELTGVRRSAFNAEAMTVTVSGVVYPVSDKVQCYNETAKSWFTPGKAGMEAARAYSDDLTIYYDKAPSEGGKIRLIIVK